jgi:hypothetical protein
MIHTDEDDEFERIAHENAMRQGQPYHYDVFVSTSQRNQVLEEAARVADGWSGHYQAQEIAKEIRSLKK